MQIIPNFKKLLSGKMDKTDAPEFKSVKLSNTSDRGVTLVGTTDTLIAKIGNPAKEITLISPFDRTVGKGNVHFLEDEILTRTDAKGIDYKLLVNGACVFIDRSHCDLFLDCYCMDGYGNVGSGDSIFIDYSALGNLLEFSSLSFSAYQTSVDVFLAKSMIADNSGETALGIDKSTIYEQVQAINGIDNKAVEETRITALHTDTTGKILYKIKTDSSIEWSSIPVSRKTGPEVSLFKRILKIGNTIRITIHGAVYQFKGGSIYEN